MADVDRLAQHDSTRKNELLRIKRRPIYPEYEGYTLPPNMMRRKRLQQLHRSLIKMEKQQRRNDIRKERINARLRDKHIRKLNGVNAFIEDEGIDNERDLVEQYEKMRRPHPYAQRRARSRKRRDTITFAEGGTKVSIGEKHEKSTSSGSPANKSSSPRADSGNSKSTVTGSKDKKTASNSEDVQPAALSKRKTNSPPAPVPMSSIKIAPANLFARSGENEDSERKRVEEDSRLRAQLKSKEQDKHLRHQFKHNKKIVEKLDEEMMKLEKHNEHMKKLDERELKGVNPDKNGGRRMTVDYAKTDAKKAEKKALRKQQRIKRIRRKLKKMRKQPKKRRRRGGKDKKKLSSEKVDISINEKEGKKRWKGKPRRGKRRRAKNRRRQQIRLRAMQRKEAMKMRTLANKIEKSAQKLPAKPIDTKQLGESDDVIKQLGTLNVGKKDGSAAALNKMAEEKKAKLTQPKGDDSDVEKNGGKSSLRKMRARERMHRAREKLHKRLLARKKALAARKRRRKKKRRKKKGKSDKKSLAKITKRAPATTTSLYVATTTTEATTAIKIATTPTISVPPKQKQSSSGAGVSEVVVKTNMQGTRPGVSAKKVPTPPQQQKKTATPRPRPMNGKRVRKKKRRRRRKQKWRKGKKRKSRGRNRTAVKRKVGKESPVTELQVKKIDSLIDKSAKNPLQSDKKKKKMKSKRNRMRGGGRKCGAACRRRKRIKIIKARRRRRMKKRGKGGVRRRGSKKGVKSKGKSKCGSACRRKKMRAKIIKRRKAIARARRRRKKGRRGRKGKSRRKASKGMLRKPHEDQVSKVKVFNKGRKKKVEMKVDKFLHTPKHLKKSSSPSSRRKLNLRKGNKIRRGRKKGRRGRIKSRKARRKNRRGRKKGRRDRRKRRRGKKKGRKTRKNGRKGRRKSRKIIKKGMRGRKKGGRGKKGRKGGKSRKKGVQLILRQHGKNYKMRHSHPIKNIRVRFDNGKKSFTKTMQFEKNGKEKKKRRKSDRRNLLGNKRQKFDSFFDNTMAQLSAADESEKQLVSALDIMKAETKLHNANKRSRRSVPQVKRSRRSVPQVKRLRRSNGARKKKRRKKGHKFKFTEDNKHVMSDKKHLHHVEVDIKPSGKAVVVSHSHNSPRSRKRLNNRKSQSRSSRRKSKSQLMKTSRKSRPQHGDHLVGADDEGHSKRFNSRPKPGDIKFFHTGGSEDPSWTQKPDGTPHNRLLGQLPKRRRPPGMKPPPARKKKQKKKKEKKKKPKKKKKERKGKNPPQDVNQNQKQNLTGKQKKQPARPPIVPEGTRDGQEEVPVDMMMPEKQNRKMTRGYSTGGGVVVRKGRPKKKKKRKLPKYSPHDAHRKLHKKLTHAQRKAEQKEWSDMRRRFHQPTLTNEEQEEKNRRIRLKMKQKNIVMPIMTKHLSDQQRMCKLPSLPP